MKNTKKLPPAALALICLCFALGSCEHVAVAILPDIAAGLDADLGAAGKLVSVFAAGYAVGTPLVMAATGRMPKYRLLMGLLALFLLSNAMSMLAPSLTVLYGARMLSAVLTGSLTAVALLFVRAVTDRAQSAGAVSLCYAGVSLATVVGNPLNKLLCRYFGWRAPFGVIVVLGAVLLPLDLTAGEESGFFRQFAVLRDGRYTLAVLMTVCSYGASYVVYTYVTPILTDVLGVGGIAVSPLLMVVGLCCVTSNLLAGWLGERGGVSKTPAVLAMQATGYKKIVLAGGVSANKTLQNTLAAAMEGIGAQLVHPTPILCTDNAVMIACRGHFMYQAGYESPLDLNANPSLKLG